MYCVYCSKAYDGGCGTVQLISHSIASNVRKLSAAIFLRIATHRTLQNVIRQSTADLFVSVFTIQYPMPLGHHHQTRPQPSSRTNDEY